MWYTILLTFLILDAVVLIGVVLLQAGKGGGLAASFGGASSTADLLIGARQAGNLLTTVSWWCGGIFLFLAFLLSQISTSANSPKSVLDAQLLPPAQQSAPAVPASAAPSALPLTATPPPGSAAAGSPAPTQAPASRGTPPPATGSVPTQKPPPHR
jgi:preprotein translocase subunit SecG